MKTLEQDLAQKVYKQVAAFANQSNDEDYSEYSSMAKKLPVLIHTAGLVQALAFVNDRGKAAHKELVNQLANVLDCRNADDLLEKSRTYQFEEYRYLTLQVVIALTWFKRFAQSVQRTHPGGSEK